MKVLEVKNIQKRFGHFTAVDNLSFSIDAGVVFGKGFANFFKKSGVPKNRDQSIVCIVY